MSALLVAVLGFGAFGLAYRFYGGFLSRKLLGVDPGRRTPAHELRDGVDFVPTRRAVLFGHHFTSIAGVGPIAGPAIAVIWGWVPALLWVVLGSMFAGGVHDLGALVVSARHDARSVGDVARDVISPTARTLFLLVILFMVLVVLAVFCLVIGLLFTMYPASVLPIWLEVPLAIWIGYMIYERRGRLELWSLIALGIMYFTIFLGTLFPLHMPPLLGSELTTWIVVLMIYCYIASTLPVHRLLQPRDYINAHELFVAMVLMVLGLLALHPKVVASAFNLHPEGAPPILPFLFVIVACGAISGFHSLVASGTSSKQLDREQDAQAIGYGSMLAEGTLAVLVILACVAGIGSSEAWSQHYASWATAKGLGAKLRAFVEGGANFLGALGIPHEFGAALLAVVVVSFAATTLDTATRIQRYVVTELATAYRVPLLSKRHPATLLAVGSALVLALAKGGGRGGMVLWPLFGTSNQLLAGLTLLVVSVYLFRKAEPVWYTLLPMLFVMAMTGWATVHKFGDFISQGQFGLAFIGGAVLVLEVGIVVEAVRTFSRGRPEGVI
ncbi:MAG TPA: carbon starvation protein A [Candidatus Latescibacteria bacterium]|nr:carbon starvation protein A [Candidatus Latescibacterota bacterium]